MRPSDGFWGVAERIALMSENESAEKITRAFPCQTELAPGIKAIEHRRADCVIETAFLHDLAAEILGDDSLKSVADNLIDYLLNRSGLLKTDPKSDAFGLWGWAAPICMDNCWTDDNAWVATLLLLLARRGREELWEPGIATARALYRMTRPYLDHLETVGHDEPYRNPHPGLFFGLNLNPHWLGLVTMAFAHASTVDDSVPYAEFIELYYRHVVQGPPAGEEMYRKPITTGLNWTISEFAYLALIGSICFDRFGSDTVRQTTREAIDVLLCYQQDDGHLLAEHTEAPPGEHVSDLIYTDNWAALALHHAARVFDDDRCRVALEKKLTFLASIQDTSDSPHFNGCWRGMFDTRTGQWGGGDKHEGGAGSIYSGWTNAPICWAFLMSRSGESLLAAAG